MASLAVNEGRQSQTPTERISYEIDVSNWMTTPGSGTVTVWDVTDPYSKTNVTGSVTDSASCSVSGSIVALPHIHSLTDGNSYLVAVVFSGEGNTLETSFRIKCVDWVPD